MNGDEYMKQLHQGLLREAMNGSISIPRPVPGERSHVLEEHGFLHNDTSSGQMISGNVHELFRHENWSHCLPQTDEAWKAMSSTFTLATKLLNTDSLRDWWFHMAFGSIALDTASQKFYIEPGRAANNITCRLEFDRLLERLTDSIKFFWQPHKLASGQANWGTMYNSHDHFLSKITKNWNPGAQPKRLRLTIGLSTAILYHLVRSSCESTSNT